MLRILLTGGGTGGHIYPLLAVIEKIKSMAAGQNTEAKFYYLGAPGDFEEIITGAGVKIYKLASSKVRRYFDFRNIFDIPKFFISVIQAFWRVFWIMPDVLFSKGGSGSLPVVFACWFYKIPIIIHESDAVPGLTNLIAARFAKRIGISFSLAQNEFKKSAIRKIALVGNPIRDFLFESWDKQQQEAFKKRLEFDAAKPLVLVIGGSQGSSRLNDFVLASLDDFIKSGYQIYHQTGAKNFNVFSKIADSITTKFSKEQKMSYKMVPYFKNDIREAYIAADIIISRSGSGSIFEISAIAKPSILIPLEGAANDHQRKNAYEYARTGAAIVIEESNLKPGIILSEIDKIFSEPDVLNQMAETAKRFSKPDAAKVLAEEIIKTGLKI